MPSRRTALVTVGALLSSAGCVGELPAAGDGDGDGDSTPDEPAENVGGTPTETSAPEPGTETDTGAAGPVSTAVVYELHHAERDEQWVLVEAEGVRGVGAVTVRSGNYFVPVALTESGRTNFEETVETAGVYEAPDDFAVHTVVDGEPVHEAGLTRGLVEDIESGEWGGRFRSATATESDAEQLRENLLADGD